MIVRSGIAALLCLCVAAPVLAQSRIEFGFGVSWSGGFDAGGADAQLTRNPATGSSPLTLFSTTSRVEAALAMTASAGLYLTRHFEIEATADYSRPVLTTAISGDFEQATGDTAESRSKLLVAGGSVLYHFGAARLTPFVFGGAGWLRQLDEDNAILVTGGELHGGAGVKYRLNRHFALRGDGGVSAREKSLSFDESRRIQPRASGGILYRW
ncbi:MAG TPA: outer membrane beta-barrel protein [Vicinamibacterales bacterium]